MNDPQRPSRYESFNAFPVFQMIVGFFFFAITIGKTIDQTLGMYSNGKYIYLMCLDLKYVNYFVLRSIL
jgi:hypothetical protein